MKITLDALAERLDNVRGQMMRPTTPAVFRSLELEERRLMIKLTEMLLE